jgi:hypothetical protein
LTVIVQSRVGIVIMQRSVVSEKLRVQVVV